MEPLINTNEPTVSNSNTKLGAAISFFVTLLILFLPEFGVHIHESLFGKLLWAIDAGGMLFSIYGLRDAIWKNLQLKCPDPDSVKPSDSNP